MGAAALAFAFLGASPAAAGVADPDSSFGQGGSASVHFDGVASADAIAVAPDGDLVVVGSVEGVDGHTDFAIARLNPDGTLDPGFSGDGRLTLDLSEGGDDAATGVAIRPDGRIVVGGVSSDRFVVLQLLTDGTPDGDFAGDGTSEPAFGEGGAAYARDLVLDAGGNVVVVGSGESEVGGGRDAAMARLTPEGQLDESFAGDGTLTVGMDTEGFESSDSAAAVSVLADGDLAIAGDHFQAPDGNGLLGRVDGDGSVETLKSLGSGRFYAASDVATVADGTPLAVGHFQPHGAPGGSALAWALDPSGQADSREFTAESGAALRARARTVAALDDGRAVIGGAIGDAGALWLFDPGSSDGFVASGEVAFTPNDVAETDGKVVAAGGSPEFTVARFLPPTIGPPSAPETKIVSGPRGKVAAAKLKFRFRSRSSDASFECKLDGRRWRRCASPYRLRSVAEGRHRFKVRAVSSDGKRDPTPAKRRFTVG